MYNEKKENNLKSQQILSAKSVQKRSPASKTDHLKLSDFKSLNLNKSETVSPVYDSFRSEKLFLLLNNDGNRCILFFLDEMNDIKCEFVSNVLIIKEYEGWINLMLQILNIKQEDINHIDFATPIQKVYLNF